MKRFLVVLLSLGLIMSFGVSAFAVTPELGGEYWARGWYFSNPSLLDENLAGNRKSFSYVDQRLRLFLRLKIVDGVTFTSRMDLMETIWGLDQGIRPAGNTTAANQANISIEQTNMAFATKIGQFKVGYMSATPYSSWGTPFMDSTGTAPGVTWQRNFGKDITVLADWFVQGRTHNPVTTANSYPTNDTSNDLYDLGIKYKLKSGDAGLLWSYFRQAAPATSLLTTHVFQPYIRTKLGPVNLGVEAYWMTGKDTVDDNPATVERDISTQGLFLDARYDAGPAYVGGRFFYLSGDDPTTADEREGSMNRTFGYARDKRMWGDFMSLMWNLNAMTYAPIRGNAGANAISNIMDNAWIYQIYGGYAPTKKLDLSARFAVMKADEDPVAVGWQSKDYGNELDAKATYKIYDTLTYNVGAAYLWTGDYFKGTNAAIEVQNNYLLLHWLDLTF